MVHVSATCEATTPHLLPDVQTTSAAVHEAMCTDDLYQALTATDLAPQAHWVAAAYGDAALLVQESSSVGHRLAWFHP